VAERPSDEATSVPQPEAGLKVKLTPAFFESFEIVAEIVTAPEPALRVDDEELEARLTLIGLLPPPQLASMSDSSSASDITRAQAFIGLLELGLQTLKLQFDCC